MSSNRHKLEKSICYMISDEMGIYLYVFGALVEDRIGGNTNDGLIVANKKSRRMKQRSGNPSAIEPSISIHS